MFIRFDVIQERDRRMDRQTDRQHCMTAKTAVKTDNEDVFYSFTYTGW